MDFRIFIEPQQDAGYEDLLRVAQATESLGFDGLFRSDHYLAMSGDGRPGPSDAWTSLAGLARETSRITLGTLVSSVTYRLPGILAVQVAQVDQMSGGRVELGLGTGWFQREHEAFGIPFPAKRFGMLEEQLQILTGLWSTPESETYSFAGEHYTLTDAPGLTTPARQPLPIIIGGGGAAKTPALAARYASEFNTGFADLDELRARSERARRACEATGRAADDLIYSVPGATAVGTTTADALRRAENIGRDLDELAAGGFAGTADQVVERIGTLAEFGVTRVYFQILDLHDLDQLDFIAREVIPQLS